MLAVTLACVLPSIWIVDASNGPGTHFTDLPQAIVAAADGDTILVRSGNYTPFQLTGKALWLRGAGAATTIVASMSVTAAQPSITVDQTPAGQSVRFTGLSIRSAVAATASHWALIAQAGANVTLVDCVVSGTDHTAVGDGGLLVAGGEVHAARCTFRGGNGLFASLFGPGDGGDAIRVENGARFAGDAILCEGGLGLANPLGTGTHGGDALAVDTATAVLARSTLHGGEAQLAPWAVGGAAVRALGASFVRLAGNGTDACTAGSSSLGTHTPALVADVGAQVLVHGPIVLAGSTASGSTTSGAVTAMPRLPRLTMTGGTLPSGETNGNQLANVDLDGSLPGAPFVYVFGTRPAMVTNLAPAALGEILVDLPTANVFAGVLDAAGHLTFPFTAAGAGLLGLTVHTQAAVFDPASGKLLLSNADVRTFAP